MFQKPTNEQVKHIFGMIKILTTKPQLVSPTISGDTP
jgi:hypothetical protein